MSVSFANVLERGVSSPSNLRGLVSDLEESSEFEYSMWYEGPNDRELDEVSNPDDVYEQLDRLEDFNEMESVWLGWDEKIEASDQGYFVDVEAVVEFLDNGYGLNGATEEQVLTLVAYSEDGEEPELPEDTEGGRKLART